MRVCAIVKYPPIQGGVSAQSYWLCRALAEAGHEVHVVTNASEVEESYRMVLTADDRAWLEPEFARGRVRVHVTEPFSPAFGHVPQGNPFVSKLAGLAAEVVRSHRCEVIFSYYMEPYGVAAHLCSAWTGIPYVVRYAGSDLGRLMNRRGLATVYREVLRRADGVCAGSPYPMLGLGVQPDRLCPEPQPILMRRYFHPEVEPLDLDAHLKGIAQERPGLVVNARPLDPSLPVIGMYGKVGVTKGSFDLVAALGALRREGVRFQLVILSSGGRKGAFLEAVEQQGLAEVTWVLPFVAHWKVGRFIRACRAVCFLERDFPIAFHAPTVPTEVLASGTCLILSGEIAAKQAARERFVSGENVWVVPDPRVHGELAAVLRRVIEDEAGTAEIGRRGAALVDPPERDLGAEYERLLTDVLARRQGLPGTFSSTERGLPESRSGRLREMVPALIAALGEHASEALAAYLEGHTSPPGSVFEDAAAFCREVETTRGEGDPVLRDVARHAGLRVWMGWITAEDEVLPPFDAPDAGAARLSTEGWKGAEGLVPRSSRWLRLERFTALPAELSGRGEGEVLFAFHKRPNANGHHFRVNRWTAELLRLCDGTRTVAELFASSALQGGRPSEAVRGVVTEALARLHREGLIILAEQGGGR